MYAHGAHIPQPPHSAGSRLKGFRAHIAPHQIPSPTEAIEADRAKWENETFLTLPGTHVPQSTTDFVAIDQGNSSPKFVRLSTYNIPATTRLTEELDVPLVAAFQPFSDQDPREQPIPLVDHGEAGPVRCQKCRAYINPWVTWTAGGNRWKCNLCGHETDVPSEYYSPLDVNLMRQDNYERPELRRGTVDFVVSPQEYWAAHPPQHLSSSYSVADPPPISPLRTPEPMRYTIVIELSPETVQTGFLSSTCEALRCILFGGVDANGAVIPPSIPPECTVAIFTFDSSLHFYNLSPNQTSASMLLVPDVDEPFLPLPISSLFVDPQQSRTVIEGLLSSLEQRDPKTLTPSSCFGSALKTAFVSLATRGGHIIAFAATLPSVGFGVLSPLSSGEEAEFYDTSKEKTLYAPRNLDWRNLAEDCAGAGVGVSMFLAPSRFIDIGSIGAPASVTGGELFFHPRFDPIRDGPILSSQLRRLVTRTTGYNCSLRIRCSYGLRVNTHYGNFHIESPDTLVMGVLDADKAILCTLEHTRSLSTRQYAYLQCATLHTTVSGERRVRVVNIAVQVAELAGNVFRYADMDVVVSYLTRYSISRMASVKMSMIRDELTEHCSAVLYSYRRNCATASSATQLVIPEAFRALPMYTLAIHKSKALKGRNVSADVRNYSSHCMMGMSVRETMFQLYPRMMALHDLDDLIALPHPTTGIVEMPSLMRDSYQFMQAGGIYLVDNEEMQVLWIGQAVSPQLLQDLFGVQDVQEVDPYMIALPHLPTRFSAQVRSILAQRATERGGRLTKLLIARQNADAAEIEFADMLVEDHNNASLSYVDYLSLVHKQISAAMQTGASLSPGTSIRAPW
ncbi:sec24-like protein [Amylostereum chailletii]|nr:sec24-like protein [Amylostereum chailletii]